MSKNYDTVAERLRKARRARDITQTKAARYLGVSVSTISELEGGARPLSVDRLMLLAKLYKVQPVEILGANPHVGGKRAAS